MKIGVFVGSFNPVHKGHIKICNYILDKYLDKIIVIPTGNYWDKQDLIDVKDRINMLKTYESDRLIINDTLNNLEYTYEVIDRLKDIYKNDKLYLIIGADNIVNFDKWKNYKELLKIGFVIYKRNDIDINYYLDKLGKKDDVIVINNVDSIDISSTKIRELIKNKSSVDAFIDKQVLDYIKTNNLYS